MDKFTIDSPYKVLYWSFFNLAYREIYQEEPEFIPTIPFKNSSLMKLDGYPYVSTAVAKKLLLSDEDIFATPPSYDYRRLLKHFESVVEHFRVSTTSFVITEENYSYLKPKHYLYQVSYSLIVLWFAFYLDVITDSDFHLKVKGLNSELAESSILYYFKLFEYLPIEYTISSKDIDTINSQLYVEMSRFQGHMTKEVLLISEKKDLFEKQGYQEGSIVFLYEKSYITNEEVRGRGGSNKFLNKVHLAKITKVTDTEVQFHTYNFYKTVEGMLESYEELPTTIQELYGSFIEFLEPSLSVSRVEIGWDTLGVNYAQNNNSMYYEHYFITKVESVYSVPITVISESSRFETTHLPIEVATAYLLYSYGVSFDEGLYSSTYSIDLEELKAQVELFREFLEEKLEYSIAEFCKAREPH